MLDVGWPELLVLGVVVLMIFPPKTYPDILRNVMLVVNRVRRAGEEVRDTLDEFAETSSLRDLQSEVRETQRLVEDSAQRIEAQMGDTPPDKLTPSKSPARALGKSKPKAKPKAQRESKGKAKGKAQVKGKERAQGLRSSKENVRPRAKKSQRSA